MGLGRGGLAIGAAGASTSGTSQTVLSQRAAPPDRKPYLVPLLKIFGGFVVASVAVSALGVPILGALVTLAWIAATVGWIYRTAHFNANTWPVQVEQWQRSFLCHRCHHVFVPNPSTESL